MVVVPGTLPVTIPAVLMAATAVLEELHVPGVVASLSVMVVAVHTLAGPAIGAGKGFMVTVFEAKQPVGST
jgi:hypothetical protein